MTARRGARSAVLALLALALSSVASGADRADAEKALREAVAKADSAAVEEVCLDLIRCGGKEAVAPILALLPKCEGATYWQLVSGAGGFTDEAALDELAGFIVLHQGDAKSSSADLVFILGSGGTAVTVGPLGRVLEKGRFDLQLMAADALALIRSVEAVDALVAALKREEKDTELRRRLESALAALTGQELSGGAAWDGWWKGQRARGLPEVEVAEKPRDREFAHSVEKAPAPRIIVLSGDRTGAGDDERDNDFDKIQDILERHKIPHTVVKKYEFEKDPKKYLKDCQALLVNCNRISIYCACPKCAERPEGETKNRIGAECNPACSVHKIVCYKLSRAALAAIQSWVETDGGFLYTEDWGILDVLGPIWPDKVISGTGTATAKPQPRLIRVRSKDLVGWEPHFDVQLRPGHGSPAHPLMRGVWQRPPGPVTSDPGDGKTTERPLRPGHIFEHHWQIDDEAPAIEIQDAAAVTTLLESEDLAKLASGYGAVAVTFRPGAVKDSGKAKAGKASGGGTGEWTRSKSGRVLHTISHFGHQDTSEDGRALENLLLNFLLEASKQHEARK